MCSFSLIESFLFSEMLKVVQNHFTVMGDHTKLYGCKDANADHKMNQPDPEKQSFTTPDSESTNESPRYK